MEETTVQTTSGIPAAPFVEDVAEFLKNEESAEEALKKIQTNYSTYKYLEAQLQRRRENLKVKLPDIEQALMMVKQLKSKQGERVVTSFEAWDGVYAKAEIKDVDSVCLWLGANVMVEYSFDEAIELLTKNLSGCKENLTSLETEINFLKDQITTTEVNIARIFNYDVKTRKGKK
eukprot:CAMPEP_0174257552 /NCGR_PEP_ID=MMETSP0439-20130205/6667_1 /TAXON_ID=0 /ORGANISM="Stereomyxa ramosa, Strain Chinc5" /LENGTH=174 /DNA_ID=CAMNT_0015340675 /DNA_START=26 /DNA_END=550 /DNA_ORIENTATION=-